MKISTTSDEQANIPPSVVEIDLNAVESSKELHALLQMRLHLPDFYGQNWDAFWDSITGLIELPPRIRFLGWQSFKGRNRHDANLLEKCLTDSFREGCTTCVVEYC